MNIAAIKINSTPFKIFFGLQVLDVLTTLVGFRIGASEASPFLKMFLPTFGPIVGLIAGKLTMFMICWYAFSRPNPKYMFLNVCFGLVVSWNVVVISSRLLGLV